MTGGMRMVCLGVGDAFSARWYSSCMAVESAGSWLLIDCPHPIRKILHEASATCEVPLDIDRIAGVILTHLHADHASGLEDFAFYCRFKLKRKAAVLAHPDVLRDLWDRHLAISMAHMLDTEQRPFQVKCDDLFDLRELSDEHAVEFGPYSIECRRTIHPPPTFALRLRAGGRMMACSADTAYDPELIAWLSAGDLIVHETNRSVHTPYERLAALPVDLRSRMRLIHYPDDFDLEDSEIEPLEPGRLYDV
jgi:phosphoribosyl 1,2-cyclic phosphodiesterase